MEESARRPPGWTPHVILLVILAIAAVARVLFWNGPLGSDDVVYLARSLDVANGTWSTANYNGALRYGFNLPEGLLIRVFGLSDFTANLWPLLCSLAEIALVYLFARSLWGVRAAAASALILAFTPLHIASATRIHADPVVAMFLSLSYVVFYCAERRDSRWLFACAGMAMGAVFWTKELAVVALVPLVLYPVLWRRLNVNWIYVVVGGIAMLVAHFVLMYAISGDPLHLIKVVTGQVSRDFIQKGSGEDAAGFYLRYLFLDVKHTWIAPLLACGALALYARSRLARDIGTDARVADRAARQDGPTATRSDGPGGTSFVVFWCFALIGVLSLLPVSLSPLRFVMKQSNYLTLFLAPLALLAGWLIASVPAKIGNVVAAVAIAGGLLLGALEQQAYRVFTSNSRAVLVFLAEHPGAVVYGTANNASVAFFQSMVDRTPDVAERVRTYPDLTQAGEVPSAGRDTFVVLDRETWNWGENAKPIERVPSCWVSRGDLAAAGFGFGGRIVMALISAMQASASQTVTSVRRSLEALVHPLPATVYAIDPMNPLCGETPASLGIGGRAQAKRR